MSHKYLLVPDLERLRTKLANAKAPLDRYWAHFQELASADPIGEFQALPMFAWLVTGDKKYEKAIRSVYLELMEKLPLCDSCVEAQFHTYTTGAPIARFAIFLDWIWDSGILSGAELAKLAGRMVDQIYSHCYLTLKGRLPAGDNQQTSLSFACAVVGYVFGVKRMKMRTAQIMYAEGLSRYFSVLKELQPGGWCGEGSAYHYGVVAPALTLFTAFVEEVTGKDYFDVLLGKSSVRETLRMAVSTINAAGLLPGWDDYGNSRPETKLYFAWYARKTGDHAVLGEIVRHGLWSESIIMIWYNDDKVWTLLFWPDDAGSLEGSAAPRAWIEPQVCGKLVSQKGNVDLLQMWDIVEGGIPGRSHINPNNVEVCSNGQVHTCDAHSDGEIDTRYFRFDAAAMFNETDRFNFASAIRMWQSSEENARMTEKELKEKVEAHAKAVAKGCSHSTLSAHSVISLDDEGSKFIREEFIGKGGGLVNLPSLQAVRGDVSEFYRKAWGISEMKRSSLMIDNRLILIYDRFAGEKNHKFTWRLLLRPEVKLSGRNARQILREGVFLDVAAGPGSKFDLCEIRNYPRHFERITHALSLSKKCSSGDFAVAVRPGVSRKTVLDISKGWSCCGGGESLPKNLFSLPAKASLESEFFTAPLKEPTVWLGKKLILDKPHITRIDRLSVKFRPVVRLDVFVNGTKAKPSFGHPSNNPDCHVRHRCVTPVSESHFDVRGLLEGGENRIAIASSEFRSQILSGPILLLEMARPGEAVLEVSRSGEFFKVKDGDKTWHVLPDQEKPARVKLPGNAGTAVAERVLIGEGVTAFGNLMEAKLSGLSISSEHPVSMEVIGDKLFMDLSGFRGNYVELEKDGRRLTIRAGCVVSVSGDLKECKLSLRTGKTGPVFLNGKCIVADHDGRNWIAVSGEKYSSRNSGTGGISSSDLQAQCIGGGDNAEKRGVPVRKVIEGNLNPDSGYENGFRGETSIKASLRSSEWREQVTAVQSVALGRCIWAIPELVRLYEEEEKRNLYPPIRANWPFSKMLITYYGEPDPGLPEDGKRRFRLKAVLLEAFGILKAKDAAPIVLRTLESDKDFYPVLVQACIAAGRLRLKSALPILDKDSGHFEKNTRAAAVLAAKLIRGEITEAEFEQSVQA